MDTDKVVTYLVRGGLALLVVIAVGYTLFAPRVPYQKGDMSKSGGTPTYRYEDTPILEDESYTSDNESNNQPIGYYGTQTVWSCNLDSGNCYDLDADFNDDGLERLYFPKGGWVDMDSSDCEDGTCYAVDENGTDWEVEY